MVILVIGLGGAIGESLRENRRSIAIRLSLGAGRRNVVYSALRPILFSTALGLFVGLVTGFALMNFAGAAVFGVRPIEQALAAMCAVLVAGVMLVATLVASRHVTDFNFARFLRD